MFKKSLWRLHGLEWSKRPWHWGHVYLGPFECFSKLHKLAYRWTKCGSSSSGPDTWLWRYIQGRYLEWPNMLSFKLVYLWKTIRTVIYQPQWLFDFTSENIFFMKLMYTYCVFSRANPDCSSEKRKDVLIVINVCKKKHTIPFLFNIFTYVRWNIQTGKLNIMYVQWNTNWLTCEFVMNVFNLFNVKCAN